MVPSGRSWKEVTLPRAWNEDDAFRKDIKDLSTGVAWYRKHFRLPAGSTGQKVFLEFEGIRLGGEFYLNGQLIGRHEPLTSPVASGLRIRRPRTVQPMGIGAGVDRVSQDRQDPGRRRWSPLQLADATPAMAAKSQVQAVHDQVTKDRIRRTEFLELLEDQPDHRLDLLVAGKVIVAALAVYAGIGAVYGADAEKAFLPLWRKHIGFFVDYTMGVASKDKAKQDKAVADLVGYSQDFGAFLSSANPDLPKRLKLDAPLSPSRLLALAPAV